jgi:prevent-host-death family protein
MYNILMEVFIMPIIRPSSDLRNNYNEISTICHRTKSPVYITKNGTGDLAIMSIELYELLTEKYMLYKELERGINSLENGEVYSTEEVYNELDKI